MTKPAERFAILLGGDVVATMGDYIEKGGDITLDIAEGLETAGSVAVEAADGDVRDSVMEMVDRHSFGVFDGVQGLDLGQAAAVGLLVQVGGVLFLDPG